MSRIQILYEDAEALVIDCHDPDAGLGQLRADVLVAGSSSFAGGPARYAGNIAALRGLG